MWPKIDRVTVHFEDGRQLVIGYILDQYISEKLVDKERDVTGLTIKLVTGERPGDVPTDTSAPAERLAIAESLLEDLADIEAEQQTAYLREVDEGLERHKRGPF